jgi:hypothetical protein
MSNFLKSQNIRGNRSAAAGKLTRGNVSFPHIHSRFTGQVIRPDDPEYDQARTVYYSGFDRRPALIVRVVNVTDIMEVIALARETELELAVGSGGHSTSGYRVTEGEKDPTNLFRLNQNILSAANAVEQGDRGFGC